MSLKIPRRTVSWYLSQDAYDSYHGPYSDETEATIYDVMVQLCLMQLMGVQLDARVGRRGCDEQTWFVQWSAGGLSYKSFFELTRDQLRALRRQA